MIQADPREGAAAGQVPPHGKATQMTTTVARLARVCRSAAHNSGGSARNPRGSR